MHAYLIEYIRAYDYLRDVVQLHHSVQFVGLPVRHDGRAEALHEVQVEGYYTERAPWRTHEKVVL